MKNKIIIIMLFMIVLINSIAFSNQIIYKKEKSEKISSGVELINYEILTEDGWVLAHVLCVDTEDEYTKLEVLNAENGLFKLDSTLAMAKAKDAISAINADFFAGKSGKGHSIGLSINDGKVLASNAEENDNSKKQQFTTMYIYENDEVFFDFFDGDITLYVGDEEFTVNCFNKYTSYPEVPSIYTREWGEFSIGSTEQLVVTEFIIEDGKLVDISENQGPVEIPENGFVIMTTGDTAVEIQNALNRNKYVSYKFNYTPNIEKIKFAISGGATLIENGDIPETYSHKINGRNPRTCIGIDKTEKKVFLITIDGRISTSIGMTMEEMSDFLKSIGVYSAINLDGGGSTTMVAKKLGNTALSEINTPSGGQERLVSNGVGVISTAPNSEKLYGLEIKMDETNIFQGEKRKVNVIGYNQYYNAIDLSGEQIEWDYDGVDIEFTPSGEVTGNTVGEATIIAKIGKIKGKLEINILSPVNEIFVSPKSTAVLPGKEVKYTLQAKNKNGYYAGTNNDTYELKIEEYYLNGQKIDTIPEDAVFENLIFKTETSGTYIVSFSKGYCTTYAKIDVGSQKFVTLEDFEEQHFTFDPYPDEVGGNTTLSDVQAHEGKRSVKLDYEFDRDVKVRGAYIVFDNPITIPKEATQLAFWVYNDAEKDEKLKVKAIDANGHTKLIIIQDNIIHEGWQEIKYNLSGFDLPLKITDVYVAQDNETIRNNSFIYVDELGYYTNQKYATSNIKIPKDTKLEDGNNINIRTKDSYNIAFLDEIKEDNLMIEWLKNKRLIDDINKNTDKVIFTRSVKEELINKYIVNENVDYTSGEEAEKEIEEQLEVLNVGKIDKIAYQNKGYDILENEKATIITMDISQNSIRKSDGTQFENLKNDITDDDTGNIIIVMNNTIDNFDDIKERRVFVDMLCDLRRETKKNILVIHDGYFNDYSMERGVKFLAINSKYNDITELFDYRYLLISIFDNEISYEYKKVF